MITKGVSNDGRADPKPIDKGQPALSKGSAMKEFGLSFLALTAFTLTCQAQEQPHQRDGVYSGGELPTVVNSDLLPLTAVEQKLPPDFVSCVNWLATLDFPVSHDCNYREVEIIVGDVWSNRGIPTITHAWLLPASKSAASPFRFAIAWNGLVYPAVDKGEASLASDVRNLKRSKWIGQKNEGQSVSHETLTHSKAAVLFALNEPELAKQCIDAIGGAIPPNNDFTKTLIAEWAWSNFERAVCAHMRGDHAIAITSAHHVTSLVSQLEFESVKNELLFRVANGDLKIELDQFSKTAKRLEEESRRRVASTEVPLVLKANVPKITDDSVRISSLIRNLEEVNVTQWGQPGGISLGSSPIVAALVEEGNLAVGPLLKCLESDRRLTRSVSFHRDFVRSRKLIGVDQAAFVALAAILGTRTFGPLTEHAYSTSNDMDFRRQVVAEIRRYTEKYEAESESKRWYSVLKDDDALDRQWLEAAKWIVKRDVSRRVNARRQLPDWVNPMERDTYPFHGESLRPLSNPSVRDLLIGRASEIADRRVESSGRAYDVVSACELTRLLNDWDSSENNNKHIRARIEDHLELLSLKFYRRYSSKLVVPISRLLVAGMRNTAEHNPDQYAELVELYSKWIGKIESSDLGLGGETAIFEPIWRFPDEPEMGRVADRVFDSRDSRWLPLFDQLPRAFAGELFRSPLISVSAFRRRVQHLLDSHEIVGNCIVDKNAGNLEYRIGSIGRSTMMRNVYDLLAPSERQSSDIRMCDIVAFYLSSIDGTPVFELYWPNENKDRVIGELSAFIDSWGKKYCGTEVYSTRSNSSLQAHLRFSILEQPATAIDVKNGEAIFSLNKEFKNSPVRRPADATVPRVAVWNSLKSFPVSAKNQSGFIRRYEQSGIVWQVEEVLLDGQWKRFYGFVGKHILARVPAEELEFPDEPWRLPGFPRF